MGLDCQAEGEGPAGIGMWEPWWVLELRSQGWRQVFLAGAGWVETWLGR